MIRKMFAAVALMFAFNVGATVPIDTSGLTEQQVAQIKAEAAKMAERNALRGVQPDSASAMVALASTWGLQASTAAEGFAKAINVAARELGVTVNDFLGTDAGKLTAALIIWKVAGETILGMIYALLFITIGLTLARVIYTKLFTAEYQKVKYERFFGMFKGEKMVRIPKPISHMNREGEWLAFWMMILIVVGTAGIGGSIFF